MTWIKVISYEDANLKLKKIYDKVKSRDGQIDNVLSIHSLRPHTLKGHMVLYKNVLHHRDNQLPKWYLEALGTIVSYTNQCDYCFEHHFAGFSKLLNDKIRSEQFKSAVIKDSLDTFFDYSYYLGSMYAKKLTTSLTEINKSDIDQLKSAGLSDGEILEINQVTSYFNYVNRTVLGLGVNISGETLGLSPGNSNDPNNWEHN